MAELSTLARPYARAAFDYALAQDALASWEAVLATAGAVTGEPAVQSLLTDPALTSAQQAGALADVIGEDLSPQQRNFIHVLADNKRLLLLPQVAAAFSRLKAQHEQVIDVEVVSAFELSEEDRGRIEAALKRRLERDIRVNTTTDGSLLGGVLIRAVVVLILVVSHKMPSRPVNW